MFGKNKGKKKKTAKKKAVKLINCPDCNGRGLLNSDNLCPRCEGSGKIKE